VRCALRSVICCAALCSVITRSTGEATSYRYAAPHTGGGGGGEAAAGGAVSVIRPFSLPTNVPAGGCAMSVDDLLRYARFHLGDGTAEHSGERVMSHHSLRQMQTARLTKNSSEDMMGLGWHLRALRWRGVGDRRVISDSQSQPCDRRVISDSQSQPCDRRVITCQHGGSLAGHCLHVQLVPERDLCFAILTNHSDGWKLNEDVASMILLSLEGLALSDGQRTG
jgi:CubicO group peptidase (beta-lactamase class C family)